MTYTEKFQVSISDGIHMSKVGPCVLTVTAGSWLVLMALFFPSHHRRHYLLVSILPLTAPYQHRQRKCTVQSPPKLVYGLRTSLPSRLHRNWYYQDSPLSWSYCLQVCFKILKPQSRKPQAQAFSADCIASRHSQ
jgi:hypothetical protein